MCWSLGRKYDAYHDLIVKALEDDGRVHLYEKTKGKLIFPTGEDLIDGLARTKISDLCAIQYHSSRSRRGYRNHDSEIPSVHGIKMLDVGHAPKEMVELLVTILWLKLTWKNQPSKSGISLKILLTTFL